MNKTLKILILFLNIILSRLSLLGSDLFDHINETYSSYFSIIDLGLLKSLKGERFNGFTWPSDKEHISQYKELLKKLPV
jgi:hypothetical protein